MRTLGLTLLASHWRAAEACTALAIDGDASENGAAFAVENVDCDNCDFRLTYVPPREHAEGAKRPVYLQKAAYPRWVGYGRGEIYHPIDDQEPFESVMDIPQVKHTYGYYESACPLMNDQGLGIAESSCAAMLLNKAPDDKDNRTAPVAIMDAATLMQMVLERCTTARCGAEMMGEMCETYGYLPFFGEPTQGIVEGKTEWDDAGEAYTLADASGESWVVHVLGGVEGILKSVWAAQRVPKGHMVAVANEFVIGELPSEPNDDYLFSKDIFRAATAAGLWDGKGRLHFSKAFAPNPLYESAPATGVPDPLYGALRKWRLQSLVAPSLKLEMQMNSLDLPFSVAVERKLSHRDVMEIMGDHYAGTEFDMSKGMLAGPFGTPFRAEGGPADAQVPRGISILRSIYSTVSQTGPAGSRVWFGPDTAETTVYMPLDPRRGALAPAMHTGTYGNFTRESAFWAFDFVANWMQLNYQGMSAEDVKPRQLAWQATVDQELRALEARGAGLDEMAAWQVELQRRVVADWWKLADELVVKWNDMEKNGGGLAYPKDWARWVGMTNDVHPLWVAPAAEPNPAPQGYVAPTVSLPRGWDHKARQWTDFTGAVNLMAKQEPGRVEGLTFAQAASFGCVLFLAGSLGGFAAGRRGAGSARGREPLLP